MSRRLTDRDPMPFGQHKGTPLGQVPAKYLDYIIGQDWISKWPAVRDYIDRNRAIIDKELEDPKSYGVGK